MLYLLFGLALIAILNQLRKLNGEAPIRLWPAFVGVAIVAGVLFGSWAYLDHKQAQRAAERARGVNEATALARVKAENELEEKIRAIRNPAPTPGWDKYGRPVNQSAPARQQPSTAAPRSTPDPAAVRAEIERKYGTRPTQ